MLSAATTVYTGSAATAGAAAAAHYQARYTAAAGKQSSVFCLCTDSAVLLTAACKHVTHVDVCVNVDGVSELVDGAARGQLHHGAAARQTQSLAELVAIVSCLGRILTLSILTALRSCACDYVLYEYNVNKCHQLDFIAVLPKNKKSLKRLLKCM